MRFIVVSLVKLYRLLVSPYVPTTCRFYPSCSAYMLEAVEKKGIVKGMVAGVLRILKCNPFHPGGFDPVK
ncbi:MAG TPA: membrane protein insertion efficiency factor YidD [Syntrophorhabdales bacterium]|nr:membrane protein insertion efficiency factor YidD [Syntrophorhabdales bacterium]